jgi:hypothetical protein
MTDLNQVHTDVYSASFVDKPASGWPGYHFSAEGSGSRAATVLVELRGRSSWSADFAAPAPGRRSLSGLFRLPDESTLCVVERGTAFVGDVTRPSGFAAVDRLGPVVGHTATHGGTWTLLVSPWKVCGIGRAGRVRTTERLADHGVRIVSSTEDVATIVADEGDGQRIIIIDLGSGQPLPTGGCGSV